MTPDGKEPLTKIAHFLFEAGNLKRVQRSGWWLAGIRSPESVAEHSFRTAVIGYVLACLEGGSPERTASLCLFHDFAESRTSDLNPVAKRYVGPKVGCSDILTEISKSLPDSVGTPFGRLAEELSKKESLEWSLAKDADLLECALQAREYECLGVSAAPTWIASMQARLTSPSAKQLLLECSAMEPSEWWRVLEVANNS
jgi:putative hydrolase of HD superfamily